MRFLAILIIILAFVNGLLFFLYRTSETSQPMIVRHLKEDIYEVDFDYEPEIHDLSENQAEGLTIIGVTLSGLAVLLSMIYLRSNRKLDREIEVLEKQLRIDELKKKRNEIK